MRNILNFFVLLVFATTVLLTQFGCQKEEVVQPVNEVDSSILEKPAKIYSNAVATDYFNLECKFVQGTGGYTPPVASRAFAYTAITLYQSIYPGMSSKFNSLEGKLNGMPPMPVPGPTAIFKMQWELVSNAALAQIMRLFFPTATPTNMAVLDSLENYYNTLIAPTISQNTYDKSREYGIEVANAVFEYSKTDGGHEGYLHNFPAYTPPVGPGLWVPTPPLYQPALQPYWGNNRPFIVDDIVPTLPGPPTTYSEDPSSQFYSEALEVYNTVQNLTPEQLEIALFWSDDPGATFTPPGHSISIATQVIKNENYTLDKAAYTYVCVGLAVSEAFVAGWYDKYVYNYIRPVTAIQNLIAPGWLPILNTPPFPEYVSGHSIQSGASSEVLSQIFGYNYAFTDHTHDYRGFTPRSFDSFFDFADEAAISRLYGGIHFVPAIEVGVSQGRLIGANVMNLHLKK